MKVDIFDGSKTARSGQKSVKNSFERNKTQNMR